MKDLEVTFTESYDTYSDAMFRYCFFRVSNRETALELTQEAFMKSWDHVRKGGEVRNMKAFLFKTLNNLIIDWYRKKKPERLEDEAVVANIPDEHHAPDAHVEFDGAWAMSLLEKLDDKTSTAITLRYVEEWSPKEIAEHLGEKENAISVRIHRGIAKLQELAQA